MKCLITTIPPNLKKLDPELHCELDTECRFCDEYVSEGEGEESSVKERERWCVCVRERVSVCAFVCVCVCVCKI